MVHLEHTGLVRTHLLRILRPVAATHPPQETSRGAARSRREHRDQGGDQSRGERGASIGDSLVAQESREQYYLGSVVLALVLGKGDWDSGESDRID